MWHAIDFLLCGWSMFMAIDFFFRIIPLLITTAESMRFEVALVLRHINFPVLSNGVRLYIPYILCTLYNFAKSTGRHGHKKRRKSTLLMYGTIRTIPTQEIRKVNDTNLSIRPSPVLSHAGSSYCAYYQLLSTIRPPDCWPPSGSSRPLS